MERWQRPRDPDPASAGDAAADRAVGALAAQVTAPYPIGAARKVPGDSGREVAEVELQPGDASEGLRELSMLCCEAW